uniref:Uncharacterized protein n=1 Tax=Anopheles christyi TaxID=43041 RepID=A0A182JYQ7_9DIPT
MPRIKKRHDEEILVMSRSRELPETLTAGRSRRTIKPNPKYMNDEMLVPSARNAVDENDLSGEEEYIVDYEENDDPEDSGLVVRRSVVISTPQTDGAPKRRGRPPKQKNLDAPRTEPVKNLRKEVLKKLDYKTISISKSRHMGSQQLMLDGRRKLNLTMDPVDTDSADQDEMDDMDMDRHSQRSRGESAEQVNRSQKVLNAAALKKQIPGKMIDRRSSAVNKSSFESKTDGTTEEDEYDDEEDEFFNDSDAKMSEVEQALPVKRSVGRPRKHPIKQISPFGGKVLLPGMKTSPTAAPVLKRKALEMGEESKQESQQSKMLRRSYGLKSVNESNQSPDGESDDNYELDEKKLNRSSSFQTLPRGAGRPPKNSYPAGQSVKTEKNSVGGAPMANRSLPDAKLTKPSPTITIVNVSDIMKMRSKSSSDIRRRLVEQEFDSEDMSEQEDIQSDHKQEDSKTNNQLVASILERKRPISLEHLQKVRRHIRDTPNKGDMKGKQRARPVADMFTENEVVDFEDVLQKNIVSADRDTRLVTVGAVRGRGRPSGNLKQDENFGYATAQGKRLPQTNMVGKAVSGGTTRRSLQPPRILNATMKLGDNRPRSKQSGGSGDNHYSIDLTDPDNNVKLVSSSNENSPVKRTPAASGVSGQITTFGQKTGNTVRSAAAIARDNSSSLRSSQEVKKKRVTLYETWNVLHIKSVDSTMKPPQLAMPMISLGNVAADIKMPSSAWSFRTLLEKRKVPANEGDAVFTGKIQDGTISEEEKANYEPSKIMFRRKAVSPGKFNVQFDRTVTFRTDTYSLNVDGQSCKLMAAPSRLDTIEEIESLLKIVDHVDLKHSCIELWPTSRLQMRDAAGGIRRVAVSKDPVIM